MKTSNRSPKTNRSKKIDTHQTTPQGLTMPAHQGHTLPDVSCPVCRCANFRAVGELPEQDYAGVMDDGTRYTSIVRERMECERCGQRAIRKVYKFDPEKWKE